jgi:hypothetical protein
MSIVLDLQRIRDDGVNHPRSPLECRLRLTRNPGLAPNLVVILQYCTTFCFLDVGQDDIILYGPKDSSGKNHICNGPSLNTK